MTSISIVGGGIAGLTLGRCLRARGIPYRIYDGKPRRPHDYFVTIHPLARESLFRNLDKADDPFLYDGKTSGLDEGSNSARAVDSKLRQALATGQEIYREGFRVTGLTQEENGQNKLHFENGSSISASIVVDAGGEHSGLRALLLPDFTHQVLPYVVYYGSRKLSLTDYNQICRAGFQNAYKVHTPPHEIDSPALQIWEPSDTSHEHVFLRYVYSRKSLGETDQLARSGRRTDQARDIPEEFYTEIDGLKNTESVVLQPLFNSEKMRNDKLLHWLMRSSLVGQDELESLASRGVVMIGDSAHTMPILGGNGASEAILDAVRLADWIENGTSLASFYDNIYPEWQHQRAQNEAAIEKYHRPSKDEHKSAKM